MNIAPGFRASTAQATQPVGSGWAQRRAALASVRVRAAGGVGTAAASTLLVLGALVVAPAAAAAGVLQPLAGSGATPPAPWRVVGLPSQKKPFTRFSLVDVDGKRALRVEAVESYGNLVHPLGPDVTARKLSWRWRADQLNTAVDLRERAGDDTTLKVCALFDLPLDKVPFVERTLLRSARSGSSDLIPSASVCYVWDANLAVGTRLDSAFTRRVRYIVLRSGTGAEPQWASEKRDVAADFKQLFGNESAEVPPLIGIAVGADSDNTKARSLGHVADIELE